MNEYPERPIFSKEHVSQPIVNPNGETIYELIGSSHEHGNARLHSLAYITIAPGKTSLPHHHEVSEESYYILHGRGRMIIDGRSYELLPGQACLILPGQVHQIHNECEEELEFLAICAPAWYPEDSFYE